MPDSTKPGSQDGNAGTPVAAPPIEAAQPTAPPQEPSTTPAQSQAQDVQQTLEPLPATPEEFRARLEAERKKTLDEYRAKAGAEGGWMAALAPEDREFLKTNPWAIREMKAKIEGYEKAMESLGRPAEPKTQEVDPLEAEAAELVELAAKQDIEPKVFYRKMVDVQAKIARREAERVHQQQFQPAYQAMTRQQQEAVVIRDPRWQNPTVQALTKGLIVDGNQRGNVPMPLEALEQACKMLGISATESNGNGHAPPAPKPTPSLGETRTTASPATLPSLSIAERFARTASGKRMLAQ